MNRDLRPLTDAELQQFDRRTTKRPLFCFFMLAALPFLNEVFCRLLEHFR